MAKYTYKDIIIDPNSKEARDAVGNEAYYSDNPTECLEYANNDDKDHLERFNSIEKYNCPFNFGDFNYACLIVKKEPSYKERAKQWIEENNLKVGDYVKVLRKTEPFEKRWGGFWVDNMSNYIGKALKVLAINQLNGLISLECDYIGYNFPYFVLEKSEPPKPKYVPFENITEFLDAYRSAPGCLNEEACYISKNGIWLKYNEIDAYCMVTEIWDDGVIIGDSKIITTQVSSDRYFTVNDITSWEELFKDYTFLDGTPCGKLMEDKND